MTLKEARRNVRYLPIGKISESLMVLDNRITELEEVLDEIVNHQFAKDFRFKEARQILEGE